MTNTNAKTIGYNDGCREAGRPGRDATGFLSKPCSRFAMPPRKRCPRTEGAARGRVKNHPGFDEDSIARLPLAGRAAACLGVALTLSGVLPMALAALHAWLCTSFGLPAFAACMLAYAGASAWVVARW